MHYKDGLKMKCLTGSMMDWKFTKDTYCKTEGEGTWEGEGETPVPIQWYHKTIREKKKKKNHIINIEA